jgi:hypothetical protein
MNRRGFLGLLAGVAAGAVLDPEKLLWVPGRKLISIPPPAVYSPQVSWYIDELILKGLAEPLDSGHWVINPSAARFGLRQGDTIQIRTDPAFLVENDRLIIHPSQVLPFTLVKR